MLILLLTNKPLNTRLNESFLVCNRLCCYACVNRVNRRRYRLKFQDNIHRMHVALKLILKKAEFSCHTTAQCVPRLMYSNVEGMTPDTAEVRNLYRLAAEQGFPGIKLSLDESREFDYLRTTWEGSSGTVWQQSRHWRRLCTTYFWAPSAYHVTRLKHTLGVLLLRKAMKLMLGSQPT